MVVGGVRWQRMRRTQRKRVGWDEVTLRESKLGRLRQLKTEGGREPG